MNMAQFFFYYAEANIVCIAIMGILLLNSRIHGTRQEKEIWYERTLIVHILYFMSDIGWAAVLSGTLPDTPFLVVLFNFLNYILLSLLAYEWFMYMAASVRLEYRNSPSFRWLCMLPVALSTAGIVIAYLLTPQFWNSETRQLTGWYYPMMILVPMIYLTAAFVISMIRARKADSREKAHLFRLIGIYPLGIAVFGLVQTYMMDAPLFCFGCTLMMLHFYIQNLQQTVSLDPLTQLNNRGQINRYMQQVRFRDHVKTYALMLDIDNFKHINDIYGHAEGDKALILVADTLKQTADRTKAPVFIGRYGGDEFALFLQCGEKDISPEQLIEAVRAGLREQQEMNKLPYKLNISTGCDILRGSEDRLEACLARADKKLYEYKRAAKVGR